jgi:hypothetical protein
VCLAFNTTNSVIPISREFLEEINDDKIFTRTFFLLNIGSGTCLASVCVCVRKSAGRWGRKRVWKRFCCISVLQLSRMGRNLPHN